MNQPLKNTTPATAASPEAVPVDDTGHPAPMPIKGPPRSTPTGSTFVDWASLPERQTPNGIFRSVFDAPAPTMERFELHISTLNPGRTTHAPHRHPWEEILIVKEGSLEVAINAGKHRAGPGAVIFFASNDAHNVVNIADRPATYYVINFYTEATHAVREQPAAEWAPADRLRSGVVNWDEGTLKETAHDTRRTFIGSPTLTFTSLKIHATTAAAGRYPVRHTGHLNILLVILKEGMIESNIDGVAHRVGEGSLIFLAPGAVQTLRNPGTVPATYYVISVSSAETPRA
jgi:quercetin dioxygenase-like cupin family protein